jgi:CheY-like chemotaxis protein/two-component sensor histidine kinase
MLSHELRNPLAPILNALHILRLQQDENPIQQEARGMIERQVRQLSRLVDDLLEVSRITTGRVKLQQERVEVSGVIERAVEAIRPVVQQRQHELSVTLPDTPLWLYGDPHRLEQVVVNLLTNAAKYTDKGGRTWLTVKQEGDEMMLRVRDTGVGIAPEFLPRIFDLFTQADRSLDRSQGGLGIGLTLVQRLVEMHRGTVEAHSDGLGKGSEFVVRLPVLLSPAKSQRPTPAEPVKPTGRSLRVLVVEDNVDMAGSSAMLLRMSGHEVQVAYTGSAGLEAALAHQPEVVLLDIGLPEMDGYEVARRIRQHTEMRTIVRVALTGYGQESDRRRSEGAGFNYHMVKPVDPQKLQDLLETVASERQHDGGQ